MHSIDGIISLYFPKLSISIKYMQEWYNAEVYESGLPFDLVIVMCMNSNVLLYIFGVERMDK